MSKPARSKARPKASAKVKAKQPKRSRKSRPVPKSRRIAKEPPGAIQQDPEFVIYERAIKLFNEGSFQAAKEMFAELAVARNRDLAHSAVLRVRMCERRLAPTAAASTESSVETDS